jgi:hypothetical protein
VERVPLSLLVFLLAFSGMFPGWMIRMMEYSLAPVITQLQQAQFTPPI